MKVAPTKTTKVKNDKSFYLIRYFRAGCFIKMCVVHFSEPDGEDDDKGGRGLDHEYKGHEFESHLRLHLPLNQKYG